MHELPSQLEHQIDQKMKKRLRRMKIEDHHADDNNIDTAAGRKKSAQKNINMQLTEKFGGKGGNNNAEVCAKNNNIGSRESNDATMSNQVEEVQYYNISKRSSGHSDDSDENISSIFPLWAAQ